MTVHVQPLIGSAISRLVSMYASAMTTEQLEMFDYCQTLGEVYIGYVDGEFICCWGLIPPSFLSSQAYLWMWSPEQMKHQFTFIRQSQIQVQRMLEAYDRIVGECIEGNASAQRWLKWLGAEFDYPRDGKVPFVIRGRND